MSDKLQEFEARVQALEQPMPEPLTEIRETVTQELKIREGVAEGLAQDVLQLRQSSNETGQNLISQVRESVSAWSRELSSLENGVTMATESSWNVPPKDRAKELILKSILSREAAQDEVIARLESYLEELDRHTERVSEFSESRRFQDKR